VGIGGFSHPESWPTGTWGYFLRVELGKKSCVLRGGRMTELEDGQSGNLLG